MRSERPATAPQGTLLPIRAGGLDPVLPGRLQDGIYEPMADRVAKMSPPWEKVGQAGKLMITEASRGL